MNDAVQQIKDKLSIIEVVSGYVKLEKAGANWKSKCPFHNERTPSFSVSPSRNAYYCFGCGEKGDIFTFVERMEGLDFKGALKMLADRAGVVIRYEPKEATDKRERLYSLLEAAALYYEKNLEDHRKAKEYLAGRGVVPATLLRFRVGYARPEWRGTIEYLAGKGYTEGEIVAAGLGKEAAGPRGKRVYDRFRGRIMFPIADSGGRSVGFSGRFFERMPAKTSGVAGRSPDASRSEASRGDARDAEPAKYINSPETDIYHKSRVLFGYDLAKGAMRKSDFAILVEGQMDLVLSHQAGFPNTVALSGTALTHEHLALIARLTKRLVLALDADAAGIRSVGRGAHLALRAGFDLKVAEFPEGKDPADVIAEDEPKAPRYHAIIRNSVHLVDFFLALLLRQHGKGRNLIRAVEATVLPYIAEIESPLDRAHFIKRVAEAAELPETAVAESLSKIGSGEASGAVSGFSGKSGETAGTLRGAAETKAPIVRKDRIIELLFGLWGWLGGTYAEPVARSQEQTARLLGDAYDHFGSLHEGQGSALTLMAESTHDSEAAGLRHLDELAHALEHTVVKEELEMTLADLRLAEHARDGERTKELLTRSNELSARLKLL